MMRPRKLFSWRDYILFFLLISVVVAASLALFFQFYPISAGSAAVSALLVAGNSLFLAFFCVLFYGLWHKVSVEKPVIRILTATTEVTNGNYEVQIEPIHSNPLKMNELDQVIENFNLMTRELSGTETLRSDFIANVSHELKTPLASIQNYAVLLQAPDLSEEQREKYTESIITGSKRLTALITNILKLNKLENQQIFPEARTYNLSEQVIESVLGFEDDWEKKGISLDTDIEENVMIEADESLMSLVWNNLLSNAMKFTPEHGSVIVSLHEHSDSVTVMVSDTGCGMSEETVKHIFDKFYQGDRSHAEQGNGLGLALVKKVIDLSGSSIAVKSSLNQGSEFSVTMKKRQMKQ